MTKAEQTRLANITKKQAVEALKPRELGELEKLLAQKKKEESDSVNHLETVITRWTPPFGEK